MPRTWRHSAAPIIARVIAENPGVGGKALRRLLREAYPFGERKYWPYKVWCDEVQAQLGLKKKGPRAVDQNQLKIF